MDNEKLESLENEMALQRKRMKEEYEKQMEIENRFKRKWFNYHNAVKEHSKLMIEYRELLNNESEE